MAHTFGWIRPDLKFHRATKREKVSSVLKEKKKAAWERENEEDGNLITKRT